MMFPDSASSALFPPFDTCPACRATGLQPVAAGDQVIFSCSRCQCYWHIDLGWVHQVRPAAGPTCAATDATIRSLDPKRSNGSGRSG